MTLSRTPITPNGPSQDDDPETFGRREQDWRNGAIVYQVLVDRFAPSAQLDAKRALYPPPKVMREWSETPQRGVYLREAKVSSHELEFWGGDFASLRSRLDHIQALGATVLYLNPIHLATTNHKYDALDFLQISPEFGTREDPHLRRAPVVRRVPRSRVRQAGLVLVAAAAARIRAGLPGG